MLVDGLDKFLPGSFRWGRRWCHLDFKQNTAIELETSGIAKIGGVLVIATALLFYFLFSPAGIAG